MKDSEEVFAYIRTYGDEKLLVLCNFTDKNVVCQISEEYGIGGRELLIANYEVLDQEGWKLRSYEAKVYWYHK